jgi:DNA-binding CsgD family transcriptional regulator
LDSQAEKRIYLVGSLKVQNEALALSLARETGAQCRTVAGFEDIYAAEGGNGHHPNLALWDCFGKRAEDCVSELKHDCRQVVERDYLALFNLVPCSGIEEEAVGNGARGFFSVDEGLGQFMKGVFALFNGEMWIPRKMMSDLLVRNRTQRYMPGNTDGALTARELQILQMVAAGYSNSRIADELFISPHTVKTHLYSIYKKINVPSRVQAALWAVKNL